MGRILQYIRNNAFLIMIFILILPIFTWLRWDPTSWFNKQLLSNGLAPYVQVEQVEKSGLSLHLNIVHIQIPGGSNISLNRILLKPAWFWIIRGTPALHVQASAGDAAFAFNVSMHDDVIWLHDMDIHAPAGMIRNYIPQTTMLNLAGNILMSGNMDLQQHDGIPLAGRIILQWEKAASGLLGQDSLGDYQLQLASSGKNKWRWHVNGGEMLSLNGRGHLSTVSPNPALWKIDGNIQTHSRGRVASILSGMTGRDQGNLILSGHLSQLHLKFLEP